MSSTGNFSARSGGTSFIPSAAPPGSFSSDLKSTITPRPGTSRADYFGNYSSYRNDSALADDATLSHQRQLEFKEKINKEMKIKTGSENLLEALSFKPAKQTKDQRLRIESELDSSNRKIAQLRHDLDTEVKRTQQAPAPAAGNLSQLLKTTHVASPSRHEFDLEEHSEGDTESPTYIFTETLESLEEEGHPSDYYVQHANNLTELFKRHPTLKYDLVWSRFGDRAQKMLLSDSREIAAAGFRMMRYAITDRKSLSIMRSFNTDYLVMLALVKEAKASVEREQALKFVRAFLDVKDGLEELSKVLVRVIIAIAEHKEDRLSSISTLTLSEILIRKPSLVASVNGMGILTEALAEGSYLPSGSLTTAFLFLLDTPSRRQYLRSGHELEGPFAAFTQDIGLMNEDSLKTNARVISSCLKTWPGLLALSQNGFMAIRSLSSSLYVDSSKVRDLVLEIFLDVLRIKPPSWSASFLAGRRLTTYGRVVNLGSESSESKIKNDEGQSNQHDLVNHFVGVLLAIFLKSGLVDALIYALRQELDQGVRRKATLLTGEALDLANKILPSTWASEVQVLPSLFSAAALLGSESRFTATNIIYQLDSVNRTLFRSGQKSRAQLLEDSTSSASLRRPSDLQRDILTPQIDEVVFRTVMLDSQVVNTPNWSKWRWDMIQKIVEGPLLNPKRLEEAMKANKFLKRLVGFYRPFKYRFCDIRNTKPNQRYVRVGCSLMKTLLQTTEGTRYLAENKLLRQIAECLAQVDRLSGLTSATPHFSRQRLNDTLTGGYFALLGAMSSHQRGLTIIERWKMANMFYHIIELSDRDDLIVCLLGNVDYTMDSHLRVILSKALTTCSKEIRVFSTRLLRKYATGKALPAGENLTASRRIVEWSVDLLITQLYDPEVEVCEVAIKILEEACNDLESLELVVQRRPMLDHLGEIGAPLLLRFLSTSVGYHYLSELDYISQEMDDWFLGRNETYVTLVEASIARALAGVQETPRHMFEEAQDDERHGVAPPHFYRELTRTSEGCKLLEEKGHFDEFVSMIRSWGMEDADTEMILKVKGSLWAVGNIGSMDLGAPFLESSDVVEQIIGIAEGSEIMSMRGTAFFVLGLISRSVHGQELLMEHGWDVAFDEMGQCQGICLPNNLSKAFKVGHG